MDNNSPIGVFDSGLGGLTVLRELKAALPEESFVYLGDTARVPYGNRSPEVIKRYASECAGFLLKQKVKLLVVACNSASAHSLEMLRASLPIPVVGTVTPAVDAISRLNKHRKVLVIGTKATINSNVYLEALNQRLPETEVSQVACPLFVPLIEEGIHSGELLRLTIKQYLEPFRLTKLSAMILGCTHYPMIVSELQEYLGSDVTLINCAEEIGLNVKDLLYQLGLQAKQEIIEDRFFVTDEAESFKALAAMFLNKSSLEAKQLESLDLVAA